VINKWFTFGMVFGCAEGMAEDFLGELQVRKLVESAIKGEQGTTVF